MSYPIEECACHVLSEDGEELISVGEVAAEPCDGFRSAGFSLMGDYEHSLFCAGCGWEMADHPEVPIDEDPTAGFTYPTDRPLSGNL